MKVAVDSCKCFVFPPLFQGKQIKGHGKPKEALVKSVLKFLFSPFYCIPPPNSFKLPPAFKR